MKKNYLLLLLFLLLGGATVWYLSTKDEKASKSTLGWYSQFAVENADDIQKIFIGNRNGETYTITREKGDRWMVNGEHRVLPNIAERLLSTVTTVKMKYLPTQAAIPQIVKEMAAKGIKVEIYGKNNELLKAYYVGGVGTDGESTYLIMENSDQPVACEIPEMVGHIRPRYDFKAEQWRDKAIFEYQPEDIQAVSIEYPKQRNKSFKLERQGSDFTVEPFYENVKPIQRKVQQGRVEAFLLGFKRLPAESIENGYAYKDSIRQKIPFSIISVTDTEGNLRSASLYETSILTADGVKRADQIERYFADVNSGDWMLVQHLTFKEIFWAYEAFFEKAGKQVRD